jgi:hypothetical protein
MLSDLAFLLRVKSDQCDNPKHDEDRQHDKLSDEERRLGLRRSEPQALLAVLKIPAYRFKRIGLEAGSLSQWLYSALPEAELPVVGMVGKVKFEARIKELVENQPDLAELVEPLLIVLRALREQIGR